LNEIDSKAFDSRAGDWLPQRNCTTDIQTSIASAKIKGESACVVITKMRWRLSNGDVCKPDEAKQ
jgi:hypothetical protein